jgi:hypothetical protein
MPNKATAKTTPFWRAENTHFCDLAGQSPPPMQGLREDARRAGDDGDQQSCDTAEGETPAEGNCGSRNGAVEHAAGAAEAKTGASAGRLIIQAMPRHPQSHATATWQDLTHRHHGTLTTQAEMRQWVAELGNPNHHHRIVLRTEQVVWSTRRSR